MPNSPASNSLNIRKQTLDTAKFRSSRYILSQQKGQGAMSVGLGTGGAMQIGVMRKVKKQRSDAPAIIQPRNYQGGKRRSSKMSSRKKKPHHLQQSTDIDGWENVSNDTNAKVIRLDQDKSVTTPLKDEEVNEMNAIIDAYDHSQSGQKEKP